MSSSSFSWMKDCLQVTFQRIFLYARQYCKYLTYLFNPHISLFYKRIRKAKYLWKVVEL